MGSEVVEYVFELLVAIAAYRSPIGLLVYLLPASKLLQPFLAISLRAHAFCVQLLPIKQLFARNAELSICRALYGTAGIKLSKNSYCNCC